MSSFRNPVGPQSRGVYWRRRAIVLGALLVVVIVVVLIVVGRGGGSSSAAPTLSASPTPARTSNAAAGTAANAATSAPTSEDATATPTAGASASASPSASATTPVTTKAGATCRTAQISLKAITDKTAYAATEEPKIAMSITNTGSAACHMDLGSAQQVLVITSGQDQYWSSKDCQTNGTDQDVTIKAGQTLTTPSIAWDRTRSSTSTCDATRSSVPAGGASYHLKVSVGNISSATSAQFVLN